VPATEGATLAVVMSDPIKLRDWQVHGLVRVRVRVRFS